MTATSQILRSHFSAATRKALAKRGITLLGLTTIPGAGSMPFANGETGYQISDNGTGRILTFRQMLNAAA